MITVEQRIRLIILIEKKHKQEKYSEKLGVIDLSKFHGEVIGREEEKIQC